MIKQYELDPKFVSTGITLHENLVGGLGKCPLYLSPGFSKAGGESNYFQDYNGARVVVLGNKLLIGAEIEEDLRKTESRLIKICARKKSPIVESEFTLQAFNEQFFEKFMGQPSEQASA